MCVCVCMCLWAVCYHDNSKMRASILTKLGLLVKVVTISSWLNFGRPAPRGKGVCGGAKIFGSALLQPERSFCVSFKRFYLLLNKRRVNHTQWCGVWFSPHLTCRVWCSTSTVALRQSDLDYQQSLTGSSVATLTVEEDTPPQSTLANYSVCTMSLCLAVVTVTKHQHDRYYVWVVCWHNYKTGQWTAVN